jgi:fructose-1,6-bisphosphatase
VGALRYFVSDDDSFSDLEFASGFNDDAEVMNHVLEELGLEQEVIDIDWGHTTR